MVPPLDLHRRTAGPSCRPEPPILPPEPPPEPLPPGVYPIIGPEIATYGVVQPIARQLGMTTLGTLQDRIGDTLTLANTGGEGAGVARSAWARFLGQRIDNRYRAFADPRASAGLPERHRSVAWRMDAGPSRCRRHLCRICQGNIDVDGLVTNEAATGYVLRQTGSLNLDAWSAGGYWTHYGPSDWYLDAVAQGTLYKAPRPLNSHAATTGFGFVSSLEAGYPVRLPLFGPGFVLEPQAQIVWQHVSFDDANDGLGEVALGTTSGASGRIGLRGRWTIVGDSGQVWQPYVRANLWRDWGAQATTMFSASIWCR